MNGPESAAGDAGYPGFAIVHVCVDGQSDSVPGKGVGVRAALPDAGANGPPGRAPVAVRPDPRSAPQWWECGRRWGGWSGAGRDLSSGISRLRDSSGLRVSGSP
ncbi:hypothetical protein GCM10018785_02040 [Streptomyces longispororuber]|uniref:Uncharacterized protein n=1 Tax=Streptomyces longispororuber TaxID=68230 RepID=A0A918Z4J2_9ACTN|nr:hypothetical protein GCM10018785_02040 [Streptomyces longispororuber]